VENAMARVVKEKIGAVIFISCTLYERSNPSENKEFTVTTSLKSVVEEAYKMSRGGMKES
jgi:hypothetical protein